MHSTQVDHILNWSRRTALKTAGIAALATINTGGATAQAPSKKATGVELRDVELSPNGVVDGTTSIHTLTFKVANLSADGEEDSFTISLPSSINVDGVTITETDGLDIDPDEPPSENPITFTVNPESSVENPVEITVELNLSPSDTDTDHNGDILLTNFSIEPSSIDLGEAAKVSVEAENTSGDSTSETIELLVDEAKTESETLSLGSGESTVIEFEYTPETNGTLDISVGSLTGSLDVFATEVGGIIESDTTWSKDTGSYLVTETVQVAEDAKLTIEPGVMVHSDLEFKDDALFLLHGEIVAEGTSDAKILVDGHKTGATFFDAEGSSPAAFLSVDHCVIRDGGSFWWGGHGGFNLRNSELTNVDYSYIWYPYDTSSEDTISRSEIHIEYNTFIDAGIFSIGHAADTMVYIRNNIFTGWNESPYDALITNWASYDTSETVVRYNSFLGMTDKIVLKLRSGYDDAAMIGTNNFWDTTDDSIVERMIYDSNDDIESAGEIPYTPILEQPDPETPKLNR